ncbi:MAG: Leucinerich repeat protein-like protein [Flavipsychrobacter sp.]|jgi:sugar lactone lactonase YvrE|nr:Leucinerich repeat protein-like protein [Flavipsychrobacter sp.]
MAYPQEQYNSPAPGTKKTNSFSYGRPFSQLRNKAYLRQKFVLKNQFYPLIIALLLFVSQKTGAQLVINTLAGNGTAAYSGDTGPATAAQVNTPHGIAVDAAGNVYFTDCNNHRIRKIDTSGVIKTVAGTGVPGYSGDGGPATAADLYNPRGIAVDGAGNIFFSDYVNHRIRKVTPAGIISTVAGTGFSGFSGDGGPATAAQLKYAWGIAVDGTGNLYIADQNNCRVRKVNSSGIISTIAGNGICFIAGDGGPATAAVVQYPLGVACDASGNVYLADYGNNRIRKINPAGIISTIAGSPVFDSTGDGGPASAAKLYYPMGIAVDIANNIYICDVNNYRIRRISATDTMSTIAGNGSMGYSGDGGPPIYAQINRATGVAIGNNGKIYIADNDNHRIRVLEPPANAPIFFMGEHQLAYGCVNTSTNIDSFLAVFDIDTGQTETWSIASLPSNGILSVSYTTISTGDTLYPSGLTYTPMAGFSGMDVFEVRVFDGTYADTTMIHFAVVDTPDAGTITHLDSMCPGETYFFSSTIPGGTWLTDNGAIATVSADGMITAVASGTCNISYIIANQCGADTVIIPLLVRAVGCPGVGVPLANMNSGIAIAPNPNSGRIMVLLSSAVSEDADFVITNTLGEKVREFNTPTNSRTAIDLNAPPGIYFISATTAHGKWTGKIIVQ